jgi:uncharacterized protein YjiS (DUF1127 family)
MLAMNPFSLTSRFANNFSMLGRSQRREAKEAYHALSKFDDFMLKDIGLSRLDVDKLRRR